MDITTAVVIVGSIWSVIAGVGIYVYYTGVTSRQLEEFRQENISLRAQNRPKEWWQEVVVNLSNHPEIIEKLLPMAGNTSILQILQQLKR